jgi:hypothetical protein
MSLKTELTAINFDNPESLKNMDFDRLAERMLKEIGSTDPELRDDLIYRTFARLIHGNYLTPKKMTYMTEVCLENLFLSIGKRDSDSVFTRSFSALVIALILEKDREQSFLDHELAVRAIESSIQYLKREEDIRGFVKEKGWAHSIAHGADLLTEAVKHPAFSLDSANDCLEAIHCCLIKESIGMSPYIDDEDERLIFAIEALLDKGMEEHALLNFVVEASQVIYDFVEKGFTTELFRKRINAAHFLKSLYFRLAFRNEGAKVRETILQVLEKGHHQLYT